ncbi:MAG TPA: pentapeptide repeat-containing protein [Thermomicrobiales bacterium]|nr:pentapeptide repeat-containing protein [Thermomicrobiales bacterium]
MTAATTATTALRGPKLPRRPALVEASADDIVEEATLTGRLVRQVDLRGREVEHFSLQRSVAAMVEASGANLGGMAAVDVRFEGCDFSNATLDTSRWTRIEAESCKFTGAVFNQTLLQDARLSDCRADYAQWQSIKSQGVLFDRCNLHHAFFNNADLSGVRFLDCDLSEADFSHANLAGVDLRGSLLERIVITVDQLRNVTVTSDQALYLCGLIGLRIDDGAPTRPGG